jgi:hypothetical protein
MSDYLAPIPHITPEQAAATVRLVAAVVDEPDVDEILTALGLLDVSGRPLGCGHPRTELRRTETRQAGYCSACRRAEAAQRKERARELARERAERRKAA